MKDMKRKEEIETRETRSAKKRKFNVDFDSNDSPTEILSLKTKRAKTHTESTMSIVSEPRNSNSIVNLKFT